MQRRKEGRGSYLLVQGGVLITVEGSEGMGALRLARDSSPEFPLRRRRSGVLVPVDLLQRKTQKNQRGAS